MTSPTTDAVRSPTAGSGRESAAGRRRGRTETGEGTWSIAHIADEFGVTHDELAARIGRSRPVITNMIRLMRLPIGRSDQA